MKILVVEDSTVMRSILRQELETANFEVYEAENGLDALKKAEEIRPHLITMDVDMPVMNGFDAVYKIRTELKLTVPGEDREVPIIMVTANDNLEGRNRGFQVGAADFIIKPFLKGEVAAIVRNLLLPESTLQGTTALIVEDSALTRSILVNALSGEGIKTLQASNGVEALQILKEGGHEVDLVLTDFVMPEMDGDELCKCIRIELGHKNLPIIFLTALSESNSMMRIFKSGASDYIVKPFAKEELLARVKVHLETRRLNNKLTEQVLQLKRLNKLKDDVLSVTSHDLRSPITGILGFTELLLEDENLAEHHLNYLSHIKDSVEFLLTLVSDILELGRAQSFEYDLVYEPLQLMELIDSSINTVHHMASPKDISLDVENRLESDPVISGDKNAIIRIVNNLLSNAIKFTPKSGKVTVRLEAEAGEMLGLSVIDTGIGIPKKFIPELFDKYSKASRPGTAGEKSTGLGLSITKALIEQHGGNISVTSDEGKGTCFQVRLPLVSEHQGTEIETPDIADEAAMAMPVRILVVENNASNIKLAKVALEERGYQAVFADNGKEAVDSYIVSLQEGNKPFHIIFMDLRMPIMDGFEATDTIREFERKYHLSPVPIIAMTVTADDSWKEKSLELGINGIIPKPMSLQNVEEMIGRFVYQRNT